MKTFVCIVFDISLLPSQTYSTVAYNIWLGEMVLNWTFWVTYLQNKVLWNKHENNMFSKYLSMTKLKMLYVNKRQDHSSQWITVQVLKQQLWLHWREG